ncbi:MAG: hypothetical protein IT324_26495 [Anaerolineae bacterium]|nr:hypothetical protein [Anaerolineae bacterium]
MPVRERYVSPAGSASNPGTLDKPLDLLSATQNAQPGDLYWLMEGTYNGFVNVKKSGTADKPIVFRAMPGKRVTLVGWFEIYGAYNWLWGLEITNPNGAGNTGIGIYAAGVRLINNIVHHHLKANGIGAWDTGAGQVLYGNIVYQNGQDPSGVAHPHNIYTQNNFSEQGYKYFVDNIVLDAAAVCNNCFNFHAYTEEPYVSGLHLERNIFDNGRFLIGGFGPPADNERAFSNYFYRSQVQFGYRRPTQVEFRNNYLGNSWLQTEWLWGEGEKRYVKPRPSDYRDNTIVSSIPNFEMVRLKTSAYQLASDGTCCDRNDGLPRIDPADVFDGNKYSPTFKGYLYAAGREQNNLTLAQWRTSTSADGKAFDTSAVEFPLPTQPQVFIVPNEYEPGRANIVVYNWSKAPQVTLDLSSVIANGRLITLKDPRNMHGAPLLSGVYTGPIGVATGGQEFLPLILLSEQNTVVITPTATSSSTATAQPSATRTNTTVPPSATAQPPTATKTNTPVLPSATVQLSTATKTNTPVPSSATAQPPTATKTNTPVLPSATVQLSTGTKTNTPIPSSATVQPATATKTNTPNPSGGVLKVQYLANDTDPNNEDIAPGLNIVNGSSSPVPLAELKLRYYFTRDTAVPMKLYCDYAPIGCDKITGKFVRMGTPVASADFYLELGFTTTAGDLAAGQQTSEIGVRIDKTNWTAFNERNDYSFDGSKTSFVDWTKVTLYRNGKLVWGQPPTRALAAPATTVPPTPAAATSDAPAFQIVESNNSVVQKIGKWTAQNAADASRSRYLYSSGSPKDTLKLTLRGSSFDVIYVKHPTFGAFAVEVDGTVALTVDSVAPRSVFGTRAAIRNLPAGVHVVRIYAVSGVIAIDAFAVEGLPRAAKTAVPVQPTNSPTTALSQPDEAAQPDETTASDEAVQPEESTAEAEDAEPVEVLDEPDEPAQPAEPEQPAAAPPTDIPEQPDEVEQPTTPVTATPQPAPVGLPLLDTFDGGAAWIVKGGWQPDNAAARQGQAWFINSQQRDQVSTLEQPTPVDLRNALHPQLTFWQKANLSDKDVLAVDVTVDNGATWITLDQQAQVQADWRQHTVNLAGLRGQIIRLRFRLDATAPIGKARTVGVWIDELTIAEAPPATPVPATGVPTSVPPTPVPPTAPSTAVPPTATQKPTRTPRPTHIPPTPVPPTAVPPTAVPPTAVPPTAIPPTAIPPTAVPPTAVPPTNAPAGAPPDQSNPAPANDAPAAPTRTRRNR